MGAIGRFLVATAAGAGLGAGAALARRRRLAAQAVQAAGPAAWGEPGPEPVAQAASAPPAAQTSPASVPAAASETDVADLEAARARLRQRAAELRAEMEDSPSHG
jgi:hypothetical protein